MIKQVIKVSDSRVVFELPVEYIPEAPWGECTRWLTVVLIGTGEVFWA